MADTDTTFAIFRREDAVDFDASGAMAPPEPGTFDGEAAMRLIEAGAMEGAVNDLLFSGGGFSLTRVWFKSGYPLPRHSHDVACLYYITAGSLRIGTEELGPGDGFFVGAEVPYAYTAGEGGVELLEFRASSAFGIKLLGMTDGWARKAAQGVADRREGWRSEPRPSQREEAEG